MDNRICNVLIEDIEELQRTVEELMRAYPESYTDEEYFTLFKQLISFKNTIHNMKETKVKQ